MLINAGRMLMLLVWAFLLFNLVQPLSKPLTYFVNVTLFFMIIMRFLQLALIRSAQPPEVETLSVLTQVKVFFFGVFELLAWQKKYSSKR